MIQKKVGIEELRDAWFLKEKKRFIKAITETKVKFTDEFLYKLIKTTMNKGATLSVVEKTEVDDFSCMELLPVMKEFDEKVFKQISNKTLAVSMPVPSLYHNWNNTRRRYKPSSFFGYNYFHLVFHLAKETSPLSDVFIITKQATPHSLKINPITIVTPEQDKYDGFIPSYDMCLGTIPITLMSLKAAKDMDITRFHKEAIAFLSNVNYNSLGWSGITDTIGKMIKSRNANYLYPMLHPEDLPSYEETVERDYMFFFSLVKPSKKIMKREGKLGDLHNQWDMAAFISPLYVNLMWYYCNSNRYRLNLGDVMPVYLDVYSNNSKTLRKELPYGITKLFEITPNFAEEILFLNPFAKRENYMRILYKALKTYPNKKSFFYTHMMGNALGWFMYEFDYKSLYDVVGNDYTLTDADTYHMTYKNKKAVNISLLMNGHFVLTYKRIREQLSTDPKIVKAFLRSFYAVMNSALNRISFYYRPLITLDHNTGDLKILATNDVQPINYFTATTKTSFVHGCKKEQIEDVYEAFYYGELATDRKHPAYTYALSLLDFINRGTKNVKYAPTIHKKREE